MFVHGLPIPKLLLDLIEAGIWPSIEDAERAQNLKPIVPDARVPFLERGEDLFLNRPPFLLVSEIAEENRFWNSPDSALSEVSTNLAVEIGDCGLGSDSPILLDYQFKSGLPRVIRLKWGSTENHWILIAETFNDFCDMLGLRVA